MSEDSGRKTEEPTDRRIEQAREDGEIARSRDLSTVTVHVKRLRSNLGDHHRLQTVWGRGYLWRGDDGPG